VYEAAKSHPVHAFKASVRAAAAAAYDGPPLEMALALTAVFVMPRPGSMLWKKRPMPRAHYCVSRNDWDNLGKSVSDALNGLVWRDDGQIVVARVERWIASGDEQPHVEIEIKPA
jgi:Holliday junction resolvase RusA-like endonuclease